MFTTPTRSVQREAEETRTFFPVRCARKNGELCLNGVRQHRVEHVAECPEDDAYRMVGAQKNDLHDYNAVRLDTESRCGMSRSHWQEHKTRNIIRSPIVMPTRRKALIGLDSLLP